MKPIKVSAPGKLHILGEHAVVYGKPTIIAAVNKRCFVKIVPRKDTKIEIISHNLKVGKITAEKEIITRTKNAQIKWGTYIKNNDIKLLKSITSDPLDFPVIVIGESIKYFKKSLPFGFTLSIKSDIPVGSGMGSSSALAVAIAGAISILLTKKIEKQAANEIAFLSEQKKHGFPSGGDNSASCFGGLIWFRKESEELRTIEKLPFTISNMIAKNFSVINTGTPNESTGEMVSIVRGLYQTKKYFVEKILSSQEKLVRELLYAIKNVSDTLMIRIIRVGEKNLENMGVVSKFSKSIIREIEKLGGAAKVCGGGGKTRGTGVLLAYHRNKKMVEKVANSFKCPWFAVTLGAEGVKVENYE